MSPTVLIVAAHPDDEILGVGGTACRHADNGDVVHVLIVAEGATSREPSSGASNAAMVESLKDAAGKAARILKVEEPVFCGLPDQRLDSHDLIDITKLIEGHMDRIRPDTVYTHHGGDLNLDHGIVHRAVLTACRPLPSSQVTAIYSFETVSSTEWGTPEQDAQFHPTRYVDITATFDRKIEALQCYASEMRPAPHARSIDSVTALARLRGAQVGLEFAEGFQVIRQLWT